MTNSIILSSPIFYLLCPCSLIACMTNFTTNLLNHAEICTIIEHLILHSFWLRCSSLRFLRNDIVCTSYWIFYKWYINLYIKIWFTKITVLYMFHSIHSKIWTWKWNMKNHTLTIESASIIQIQHAIRHQSWKHHYSSRTLYYKYAGTHTISI